MWLLLAIHDGRVTRAPDGGFFADYLVDGEGGFRAAVHALRTREVVYMPMVGPPQVTADGEKLLRDAGLI